MSRDGFLRGSAIVGAATVLSRLLGFARDVLVARALGAGPVADAFLVALRLPNMVRRILSEGGLNAAFIPVGARIAAERGEAARRGFAGEAFGNLALMLLLAVGLGELIAPWLVLAVAGGFRDAGETFVLAESLTRLALPFLALTTFASLIAAQLNADRRFLVAALAPTLLNLVLIAILLATWGGGLPPARVAALLACGVSLAGALHLAAVGWALAARPPGWPRLSLGWSPDFRRLLHIGLPALLANAASQLVLLVATQIASAQPGAVSWLYYADRVVQLPFGFVAVAIGMVLLPEIAAREAARDAEGRGQALDRALVLGLALGLPAAVALHVLAEPIASVLFERGQFGPADRLATAAAMRALAWGLPAAIAAKVLTQLYYAREEPRLPLLTGFAAVLATAGLGLWGLRAELDAAWVAAAAASLGLWLQALLLALALIRARLWQPGGALARRLAAVLAAAAAMGLALVMALPATAELMLPQSPAPTRIAVLGALCLAGLSIHALLAWGLGALRAEATKPRAGDGRQPL